MEREEFETRMAYAYLLQLLDEEQCPGAAFSCLNLREAFGFFDNGGEKARDKYEYFYEPKNRVGKFSWDIETNYKVPREELAETRMAMLSLFEEICLSEKLYRRF
jgi:hypothetical protein